MDLGMVRKRPLDPTNSYSQSTPGNSKGAT